MNTWMHDETAASNCPDVVAVTFPRGGPWICVTVR